MSSMGNTPLNLGFQKAQIDEIFVAVCYVKCYFNSSFLQVHFWKIAVNFRRTMLEAYRYLVERNNFLQLDCYQIIEIWSQQCTENKKKIKNKKKFLDVSFHMPPWPASLRWTFSATAGGSALLPSAKGELAYQC